MLAEGLAGCHAFRSDGTCQAFAPTGVVGALQGVRPRVLGVAGLAGCAARISDVMQMLSWGCAGLRDPELGLPGHGAPRSSRCWSIRLVGLTFLVSFRFRDTLLASVLDNLLQKCFLFRFARQRCSGERIFEQGGTSKT